MHSISAKTPTTQSNSYNKERAVRVCSSHALASYATCWRPWQYSSLFEGVGDPKRLHQTSHPQPKFQIQHPTRHAGSLPLPLCPLPQYLLLLLKFVWLYFFSQQSAPPFSSLSTISSRLLLLRATPPPSVSLPPSHLSQGVEYARRSVKQDPGDGRSWLVLGNALLAAFFGGQAGGTTLQACRAAYSRAVSTAVLHCRGQILIIF